MELRTTVGCLHVRDGQNEAMQARADASRPMGDRGQLTIRHYHHALPESRQNRARVIHCGYIIER